ncbi:MAG: hypothetical protein PVI90_09450, partial [Desulfobacteraceae bacterium]
MKPLCLLPTRLLLLLIFIEALLAGCRGGLDNPTHSLQEVMASKIPNDNLFVAENYDEHQPLSVAILPFDNQTKEPDAAKLLRRLFYNNFSSLSYQDIELSKIEKVLSQVDPANIFDASDATQIGQQLKADAIIVGRVTQFETLYAGLYASFSVAFELKMIASKDSEVLWS